MNDQIESLLAPICPEQPAGHDGSVNHNLADNIENDSNLATVDQIRNSLAAAANAHPPFEPNWEKIRSDSALILTKASKNLEAAWFWTLASVELEGLAGLEAGLALISGLLTQYWEKLPPVPDHGDPYERVQILEFMAIRPVEDDSPYRFLHRLTKKAADRSLDLKIGQILAANDARRWPCKQEVPSLPAIVELLTETSEPFLTTVNAGLASLGTIQKVFRGQAPGKSFPDLNELRQILEVLEKTASPKSMPSVAGSPASDPSDTNEAKCSVPPPAVSNRQNALNAFSQVRQFFAANEPSSPLIPLADLALRLKDRNFLQLIDRLTPAEMSLLEKAFGSEAEPPLTAAPAWPGAPLRDRQQALETMKMVLSVLQECDPTSPVLSLGRLCVACASQTYAQSCKNFGGTSLRDLNDLLTRKDKPAEPAK